MTTRAAAAAAVLAAGVLGVGVMLGQSVPPPRTLPNPRLTPGETLPNVTAADVCAPNYSAHARHVSAALKARVYAAYGITARRAGEYEIDHLIPLCLGGSNSARNLFPQPIREAAAKDIEERSLCRAVCAGRLSLRAAQETMRREWGGHGP